MNKLTIISFSSFRHSKPLDPTIKAFLLIRASSHENQLTYDALQLLLSLSTLKRLL